MHVPDGEDVGRSIQVARRLGCGVRREGETWIVTGGARPDELAIDCGNSGTTARLTMGLVAGLDAVRCTLTGDASLSKRPMRRVAEPLRAMGAELRTTDAGTLPVTVDGHVLRGVKHVLPVASAQVKSALLLAGVHASGETWVHEPVPSRDHTERWFPSFGVEVLRGPDGVGVRGGVPASGARTLEIPSDPSSAAFFAVAASIVPGSFVSLPRVGLNPTRTGAFEVLRRAGADVRLDVDVESPEPMGRVAVNGGGLGAFSIGADEVPWLIDELPVLAVAAACATGTTRVRGAGELRVKESDRLRAIVDGLRSMGAEVQEFPDGFDIEGGRRLHGAVIDARMDHRIAMAFAVAGLVAEGETVIQGAGWVSTSYPAFWSELSRVTGGAVRTLAD